MTQQTKHTPGPWEVDETISDGHFGSGPDTREGFTSFKIVDRKGRVIVDATNSDISEINDYDYHSPRDVQGEANARLIAAAPELLEELESILWNHRTDGASDSKGAVVLSRARESRIEWLIAKATGAV